MTLLQWIETRPKLPSFVGADGIVWTPIGLTDSIIGPGLKDLFRRRNLEAVETYLRELKAYGVTCLRLVLEHCEGERRYFERPVGSFVENMVRLWDDLFELLEKVGLHILLSPFDTFYMSKRWRHHPYNRQNGGPCDSRRQWLTCPLMRDAIKNRLTFASARWGSSPALFAWELWSDSSLAQDGSDPQTLATHIEDVGPWLKAFEIDRHGRAHLQTVPGFTPELQSRWGLVDTVQHFELDFTSIDLRAADSIGRPRNSVAPALAVGRLMRDAISNADVRPVCGSEIGAIRVSNNRKRRKAEPLDDECFLHMQWAYFASGGAGGGIRLLNRHSNTLICGMHRAQLALSRVLSEINWQCFQRRNLNDGLLVSDNSVACFGCGDDAQAIVWLLRTDSLSRQGTLVPGVAPLTVDLMVPALARDLYEVTIFDTRTGFLVRRWWTALTSGNVLCLKNVAVVTDTVIIVRQTSATAVSEDEATGHPAA